LAAVMPPIATHGVSNSSDHLKPYDSV
jgi:hypothetical protein